MNKSTIKTDIIEPALQEGEELVGFFQALFMPPAWISVLFGPLAGISNRLFYVGITRKGIHLHKRSLFGQPDQSEFYGWQDVEHIELGKGVLQGPLRLSFTNGKKITLKAQLKSVETVATLDEATRAFIADRGRETAVAA